MKWFMLIIAVLALSFNSVYALAKPTNLKIEYVKPYEIKDNKIKVKPTGFGKEKKWRLYTVPENKRE